MLENLRLGWRLLAKSPGFTAIAVVVLALGTGVNATIFSIIDSILIKPPNVVRPGELVGVYQHDRANADSFESFSYLDFADLRSAKDAVFSDLFAMGRASVGLRGELTEKISASLVSANYFSALGVRPALGRGFLPEEEVNGATVAVLSHAFWKRLGSDPALVGRKLELARGPVIVVGVMPPGFSGAQILAPSIFLPLGMAETLAAKPGQPAPRLLADRGYRGFMLMGRLKPGLTLANTGAALSPLNERFAIPDPAEPKARTLVCLPPPRFNTGSTPERVGRNLAPLSGFALGLSALVLVVACLNLANMMLARGAARRKEVAIRLALGAGRRRVFAQLLTEGALLALMGGAAGLLVSHWATDLLSSLIYSGAGMPPDFPVFNFAPDWRALGALLFLSGLATVFFALGPAWKLVRLDVNTDLKRQAGEDVGETRAGRMAARDLLAVGQMAVALALLVAAVLFSRSAINASAANPGFEFGSNFYLGIEPGMSGYAAPRVREWVRDATERLSALPGVEAVSPAMNIPFGNSWSSRGVQRGGAPNGARRGAAVKEGGEVEATYNVVGANYFRALGLPLRQGREFERREVESTNAPRVAIINRGLAEELWPGENPLGRLVQFPAYRPNGSAIVMTVVGIVPPVRWGLFEKDHPGQIYVPLGQDYQPDLKFHVRVAPGADPARLMITARDELRRLDPNMPLTEIQTLAALHREGPTARVVRLGSALFGAFGVLATLLSLLGVYGLKAYAVARRYREIGIRMALGANGRDVLAMILRETARLAGLGLGLGLLLAFAVGKLAAGFLYKVPATDPLTFGLVPPLLLLMAMAASFAPARRAAKVDPMVALRHE